MRPVDIIQTKRDGHPLPPEAIQQFVDGATSGDWPDYQVSALLNRASDLPARLTAPASGLFLERVFYPADERRLPLVPAFAVASRVPAATGSRARP